MPKHTSKTKRITSIRLAAGLVLLALAAAVLLENRLTVRQSIHAALGADFAWMIAALVFTALTFVLAAAIYNRLALKKLHYTETLLVELSTAFVNRLLPSGLGGLGIHGLYLYRRKHTAAEATAVVSVNNLLGMAAHVTLLALVLLYRPGTFDHIADHFHLELKPVAIVVLMLCFLGVLAIPYSRRRLVSFASNLLTSIRKIRPLQILIAACLAALLTLTYTIVLVCSARAVGVEIGFVALFIVFSVGMLFGTASPTPGGLVGAEAGLFAALVGYGVQSADAGATVLLYRLATYWLPLLPGLVALSRARSHKLL